MLPVRSSLGESIIYMRLTCVMMSVELEEMGSDCAMAQLEGEACVADTAHCHKLPVTCAGVCTVMAFLFSITTLRPARTVATRSSKHANNRVVFLAMALFCCCCCCCCVQRAKVVSA